MYDSTYSTEITSSDECIVVDTGDQLFVQQGVTFGAKHDFSNFQPPLYKIRGVPGPQYLYPVIYFFGPLMLQ